MVKGEKVTVYPDRDEPMKNEETTITSSKNKEVFKERYSVGTIATQTSEVIINQETQEQIDPNTALVMILNKLEKIEKILG